MHLVVQYHSRIGQESPTKDILAELTAAFEVFRDDEYRHEQLQQESIVMGSMKIQGAEWDYIRHVLKEHPPITTYIWKGEPGIGSVVDSFFIRGKEDICKKFELAIVGAYTGPHGINFMRRTSDDLVLKASASISHLVRADCFSLAYILEKCKREYANLDRLHQIKTEGEESAQKALDAMIRLAPITVFAAMGARYAPLYP